MNTFIIIFVLIGFIGISYFVYKKHINKKVFQPNSEYIASDKGGELMIFYASWCPHSQTSLKEWYKYKESYDKKYNITFTEIDCDQNSDIADSYNIDSYPTIILLVNKIKYIYDAQIDNDTLTQFINTILK